MVLHPIVNLKKKKKQTVVTCEYSVSFHKNGAEGLWAQDPQFQSFVFSVAWFLTFADSGPDDAQGFWVDFRP